MQSQYHGGRTLAITAGVAATSGACALLLADPLNSGHWTLDHALTPLVVGLTVASGHLASTALRAGKPLAAISFSVAFMIGTVSTVLNGVGRQTEGAETKQAAIAKSNGAVAAKLAELSTAKARLDQAIHTVEKEMTGQKCGIRCNDWKARAAEVGAQVRTLEAELANLGAIRTMNPKAAKVAELAAALGADPAKATATMMLLDPLLIPFMLEWLAIVALGYGFGRGDRQSISSVAGNREISREVGATRGNWQPMKLAAGRSLALDTVATKAAAEADIIQLVARGESLPSQDALQARWQVHKGTVSKWVSDFERRGLIAREWDGRHKRMIAVTSLPMVAG